MGSETPDLAATDLYNATLWFALRRRWIPPRTTPSRPTEFWWTPRD